MRTEVYEMKKIIFVFTIFIITSSLCACARDKYAYDDICRVVRENESIITSEILNTYISVDKFRYISKFENGTKFNLDLLKSEKQSPLTWYEFYASELLENNLALEMVDQVWISHRTIVFECENKMTNLDKGGTDNSAGFYFSETGEPASDIIGGRELTPKGDGWAYENEYIYYYTERICDDYFYYQIVGDEPGG
jgi:hypothetical protein